MVRLRRWRHANATFRLSQIAAAEEQMRAEGKIDKEGHLTHNNHKNNNKKPKKQDE